MTRFSVFSILSLFLIASTCEDEEVCNVDNPIEELAWLKTLTEQNEEHASSNSAGYYIYQGRYKKNNVFINDICCPACMVIIHVFDCEGQVLDNVTPDDVSDKILIWQSEKSPCPAR